jgi:peptidoglycan/LPS O-acetylase OafA/YrhL
MEPWMVGSGIARLPFPQSDEGDGTMGHAAARSTKASFYRPELDALRFLAFLMVFCSHVVSWSPGTKITSLPLFARAVLASGGFGVDLFFVLSAYLITEILLREKELTGTLDVRAFYARRILRIWPLYFSVIVAAFLFQYGIAWAKSAPPEVTFPVEALVAFILLAGNWYSTGGFLSSPVAPLWSVSIEEQFYLLWPLWVRRSSRASLQMTAVVLVLVAFLVRLWLLSIGSSEAAIWCNTFARLDPIAVGIFVAATLHGRDVDIAPAVRVTLFSGGFAMLGVVFTGCRLQEDAIPVVLGMIGYPLGTAAVTMIFFSVIGTRSLALSPLLYLGQISYGLYVFHRFALDLVFKHLRWVVDLGPAGRVVAAFSLTIALAALSYRYLEKPFLRLKSRFAVVHRDAKVDRRVAEGPTSSGAALLQ